MLRGFILGLFFCLFPLYARGGQKWTNWLGNQSCTPSHYFEPKTVAELQNCIKEAVSAGYKIRVVGGGFSIIDIVCTEDYLLSLKNLNHILEIDREKNVVRVEAGITLRELNQQLECYGLALSNQAAIDHCTLAGAIATAVHGTGHTGTLSSLVQQIDLITADGVTQNVSSLSDNEAFAAAKVSLGALGVIYAITLQCEPLFYLKNEKQELTIDALIKRYHEFYGRNDFFQFTWNVEDGKATVDCWNRVPSQPTSRVCYEALTYYTPDENDKDLFSEIAIPINSFPLVLEKLKVFIKKYQDRGIKVADINVRFVACDSNCYLSPSSSGPVAYLTMSIPIDNSSAEFYREFEELMFEYQGRPHWGKIHFLDYEKALKLYGVNLEKFISVKQRLDPHEVFSNAYIDRICRK